MSDASTTTDRLQERLAAYEGKPFRPARQGKEPVNEPMIRHLVEALGDENPVYGDAEFAERSVHGGIVAPATSLQVWTMAGLSGWEPSPDDKQAEVMGLLDEHGYTSVVATNCEQEYERYLRPGDHLTVEATLESIVGPKTTGLGEGYFITTLETYRDQAGEVVGRMRFRILKFKPPERPSAPSGDGAATTDAAKKPERPPTLAEMPRPHPSTNQDNQAFWDGVEADELRIQRCTQCRRLRYPWQPACPWCHSLDWDFVVASGRGEVYSWVVHHHPPLPGFEPPYAVALVELDEGVRIVGELVDVDFDVVAVGFPVEVTFTAVDDELTVPQWRPAGGER